MIRAATPDDIADLVAMTAELHREATIPGPCEPDVVAGTFASLIQHKDGLVLVAPGGFIAAEVARTAVSRQSVAVEHGWYSRGGWGLRLLAAYEDWARSKGCAVARLSAPAGDARVAAIMARAGYAAIETAWVKGL